MTQQVQSRPENGANIGAAVQPEGARDEALRLEAVKRYAILDTASDESFDAITALAADIFDVPVSTISLVDHDRIWFKSHHGLAMSEIGREQGLCGSAIHSDGPWILTDARTDIRSHTHSLVVGEFGLRFYAGVPLRTHDGHNIGTLCVIDRQPRLVDQRQIGRLKKLATIVMGKLELGLTARRAQARAEVLAGETDHRVMNSLQFVSSLLTIQSRAVGTGVAARQLTVAAERIAAVARMHRYFSTLDTAEAIPILDYMHRLCADLAGILVADIDVSGIEGTVSFAQSHAIGLIINELVTNAKKHGAGRIAVTFARANDGNYALSVADGGEGLPAGYSPGRDEADSIGMKVVSALANQLRGTVTAGPNPTGRGARFAVIFPIG